MTSLTIMPFVVSRHNVMMMFRLLQCLRMFRSRSKVRSSSSSLLVTRLSVIIIRRTCCAILTGIIARYDANSRISRLPLVGPCLPFTISTRFSCRRFPPIPSSNFRRNFYGSYRINEINMNNGLNYRIRFRRRSCSFFVTRMFSRSKVNTRVFRYLVVLHKILLIFTVSRRPSGVFARYPSILLFMVN